MPSQGKTFFVFGTLFRSECLQGECLPSESIFCFVLQNLIYKKNTVSFLFVFHHFRVKKKTSGVKNTKVTQKNRKKINLLMQANQISKESLLFSLSVSKQFQNKISWQNANIGCFLLQPPLIFSRAKKKNLKIKEKIYFIAVCLFSPKDQH